VKIFRRVENVTRCSRRAYRDMREGATMRAQRQKNVSIADARNAYFMRVSVMSTKWHRKFAALLACNAHRALRRANTRGRHASFRDART